MDFDRLGRNRTRGFRAPEIDTDRIADSLPDVDLERLAKQIREIDLDKFAKQLREIDLDRVARQVREFDLDRFGRQMRESAEDVRDRVQGRQEPDRALPTVALLAGAAAGAVAMYLLDPERGRTRRALLRDQLLKAQRVANEQMEGRSKDMANRAQGAVAETRSATRRATQQSGHSQTTTTATNPTAGPRSELPS